MMKKITVYNGLKIYQISEQILLVFFALCLPVWWRLSLIVAYFLLANLMVKAIVTRHVGNGALRKMGFFTWLSVLAFVIMYAISLLYSDNLTVGYKSFGHHLTFVAMSALFLLSDLSYVRKEHVRIVLYAMTIALLIRFAWFLCAAIYGYFFIHHDVQLIIGSHFDPMHHAYLSQYILLSIGFLYLRLETKISRRRMVAVLLAMVFLSAYIFLIQARMGFLLLGVFVIIAFFHQAIAHRRIIMSLSVIVLLEFAAMVLLTAAPKMTQRFAGFTSVLSESGERDVRYTIMKANVSVIKRSPFFGVGVGDLEDELASEYHKESVENKVYTPHNQYLETLICTGVVGLAFLLSMLILPMIYAVRSKNPLLIWFLLVIAVSSLTESVLERQMGIQFFCLFLGLLPYMSGSSNYGKSKM